MNIEKKSMVGALLLGFFTLAVTIGSDAYAENDQQTRQRMTNEAKESADRSAKKEQEKSGGNYEVKKTHDEHIKATEKATADSQKK